MSTITPTRPSPAAKWIPKRLARLTVDQYEAMVDSGVFTKRDRFTLINGLLVTKLPKSPRPTFVARNLASMLGRLIPTGCDFQVEVPVRLPPDSKLEPDVSMARGVMDDYADRHPGPSDLAMVVEVAASNVTDDRQMAGVYGPAGIPVYWIVNLKAHQVEVYTLLKRRGAGGYGKPRVYKSGESVPVMVEGAQVGRIAVDDILPLHPAAGGYGA